MTVPPRKYDFKEFRHLGNPKKYLNFNLLFLVSQLLSCDQAWLRLS